MQGHDYVFVDELLLYHCILKGLDLCVGDAAVGLQGVDGLLLEGAAFGGEDVV